MEGSWTLGVLSRAESASCLSSKVQWASSERGLLSVRGEAEEEECRLSWRELESVSGAEAVEVDIRRWEKARSDAALHETVTKSEHKEEKSRSGVERDPPNSRGAGM